jgi:hypothetical protein
MRTVLFTVVVGAALAACSLYGEKESTLSLNAPDAGSSSCGGLDAGSYGGDGGSAALGSDGGSPCGEPDDGGLLEDGGTGGGSGWDGGGSGWDGGSGGGGTDGGAWDGGARADGRAVLH